MTLRQSLRERIGDIERSLGTPALILLIAVAIGLAPVPALAGDDETWLTRRHGTGGWDGLRQKWLEDGVVPGGFYVFGILGNPLSISINEPGFFADPVAQWGLRLLYRPNERVPRPSRGLQPGPRGRR